MKFAEGSFRALVIGLHTAFQNDFRSRRKGKPGSFAAHDCDRLFENRAHIVVLAHPERDLNTRDEVTERVTAKHNSNGERLAGLLILLVMDAAMLSRDHVDRDMATVMDHHSVGAGVHPIRIEVPRHDRAAGANVASAVQFVPERRWKSQHIDFSALLDILEHRSALHDNRLAFCCLGLPDAWLVA